MKPKFGDSLWNKTEIATVKKSLSEVICHNLC
jgi:hypothetical protein